MRTTDEPVRVLYVSGWVFSGSTLLSNILGEIEGVFAAGEVRHIWRRGLLEDRPCGCGAAFSACPFWRAVGRRDLPVRERALAVALTWPILLRHGYLDRG